MAMAKKVLVGEGLQFGAPHKGSHVISQPMHRLMYSTYPSCSLNLYNSSTFSSRIAWLSFAYFILNNLFIFGLTDSYHISHFIISYLFSQFSLKNVFKLKFC